MENIKDWETVIKSAVRPFVIGWGFVIYGVLLIKGAEVPPPLAYLVAAVIIEYCGERAIKRLKEKQ